jgi:putative photosynthetic complex assembly protein
VPQFLGYPVRFVQTLPSAAATTVQIAYFGDLAMAATMGTRRGIELRSDGSIAVVSAPDGQVVKVIEGEAGFVRGILRAMARERRIKEVNQAIPFELIARADGRLTLLDPATGNRIDLESFGKDNVIEFAVLLKPQGVQ